MRVRLGAPDRVPGLLAAAGVEVTAAAHGAFRPPADGVDHPDAVYLTHRYFCQAGAGRATLWLERAPHRGERAWGVRLTSPWWAWARSVRLRRRVRQAIAGEAAPPPGFFDPRWRTADVMALARGIYEDRAFDRLPVLADALMDAGCEDETILEHCRSEGPHVRECWVLDLVLGKT